MTDQQDNGGFVVRHLQELVILALLVVILVAYGPVQAIATVVGSAIGVAIYYWTRKFQEKHEGKDV